MPTLHGVNLSPFVRKVRVALAEKGIAYDSEPVVPFGVSDEFKVKSPLGKIPVWEDDQVTLPDSSVICAYLERLHPQPALYPQDPAQYARALWFEEYADTALVNGLTTVFFQRFVQPNFFQQEPDQDVIRKALDEEIPPVLDYLEGQLGDAEYLAGGSFSIADIATTSPFVNFRLGQESVDAARWPGLAAYIDRIQSRPSFKGIIEEEFAA